MSAEIKTYRNPKFVLLYRAIVALIGCSALIALWITAVIDRPPGSPVLVAVGATFRYFTVQSNVMVLVWLLVAIIYGWQGHPNWLLRPVFKGAFTVYISVTFLVFMVLLAPLVDPQGIYRYTNAIVHYITPLAFILDGLLFSSKRAYKWRFAVYWLAYPIAYLIFAQLYGSLTGDYLYPFLDLPQLGLSGLATWVAILLVLFILLGVIYIGINRVLGDPE